MADSVTTLASGDGENTSESEMMPTRQLAETNLHGDDKEKIVEENLEQLGDRQQKEADLLKKIEDLEVVKKEANVEKLKLKLKVQQEEIALLKARVMNLETELQAAISNPSAKNKEVIESIKQQHEELITKAKGMIFDKTKMVQNQELQITALNTQVQSLKDINVITKELLQIRNSEVKAMQDRIDVMEARYRAEKQRYDLAMKKAQTNTSLNNDLKEEYEKQLSLFKELRQKYDERVKALMAENERLKSAAEAPKPPAEDQPAT